MSCAHANRWAPVSCVVVWTPTEPRPRAIPVEVECRPCVACLMLFELLDDALRAKGIPTWSKAIVLFEDGRGAEVRPRAPAQAIALA